MEELEAIKWMDEYVIDVPIRKKLYKFIKRCLFRKKGITYKELYMILCTLNGRVLTAEESKKHAMLEVLSVYKYNNNKFPDGTNLDND